jgi:hypothetical protein
MRMLQCCCLQQNNMNYEKDQFNIIDGIYWNVVTAS